MRKTPLDAWIAAKLYGKRTLELTLDGLRAYQLARVRETVAYAAEKSPFYRKRLDGFLAEGIACLEDLAGFPFTTAEDLTAHNARFLCVSQSEIDRVVTLQTPEGTRRSFFTSDDLELTTDFFRHGMSALVSPSDRVLVLMPGDRPGSVGDLLKKALARMDVQTIVHGLVYDPDQAARDIIAHQIDALVGIPTQVLSVVRSNAGGEIPRGRIQSVLLSADYVPAAIVKEIRRLWDCPTFNHYGTTEMGLGGGVECEALAGYHMREADLYCEIIDPDSGKPQPPGTAGEVVFTTLTRRGMPLVRYRTGDLARFLPEPCPCGTTLPRMDTVRGKIKEMVRLRTGDWMGITDLDEALLALPQVSDYEATLTRHSKEDHLSIGLCPDPKRGAPDRDQVLYALHAVPHIQAALADGSLLLESLTVKEKQPITTSAAKRALIVREVQEA